ncbi:MAG: dihydrolipoyl dehydrogenase [Ignavibacteria bacterium]|jgi:dihydrolipoamide dehydrogenase|nr:dihydrolipoyl dehydrogenase [Ignavibacteria bacterium]
MNTHNVDLVVIGAGPGGYVAAIRASQLGLKTICIERENLGGVCLNWGCIPTKALLKSAEYMHFLHKPNDYGFSIPAFALDFPQVVKRSRDVANRMSQGIAFLFKKYNVQSIAGNGYIKSNTSIEVRDNDGNITDTIDTTSIIIATGARPRMFDGIDVDRKYVITSREALVQQAIPKSIVVMGAGAIGVEFSYFFNAFGSQVTIVEMQDRILPIEDADISKELERNYRKEKIRLLTSTRVLSAKHVGDGVEVVVQKKDGTEETLVADIALNAIGIQANCENLGLENIGVEPVRGYLPVDKNLQVAPNIYAIGDIAGAPWLAHKASAEGIAVAERIAGHDRKVDYLNIPGCTYCQPQVASVGISEAKAIELGYSLRIGKFAFSACGKAHAMGDARGFVKLIFDEKTDLLLGAHLIGPEVTELLGELCLAKANGIKAKQIIETIHAHPTLSEAVMEAAASAFGECVNM